MSDVIWAAAIAVAGSGLTGGIAAYASTTVARGQQSVELAKVTAERDRLRDQFREDERRNRQGTYHKLLAVLDRFDTAATGYSVSDEEFETILAEFNYLIGAIRLFGDEAVSDALTSLTGQFHKIGALMSDDESDAGVSAKFASAYVGQRTQVSGVVGAITAIMRSDVTRGLDD